MKDNKIHPSEMQHDFDTVMKYALSIKTAPALLQGHQHKVIKKLLHLWVRKHFNLTKPLWLTLVEYDVTCKGIVSALLRIMCRGHSVKSWTKENLEPWISEEQKTYIQEHLL